MRPMRLPMVKCHPLPHIFSLNITYVLYHLQLKPAVSWEFAENRFFRTCVNPKFKPYDCHAYPLDGKDTPVFIYDILYYFPSFHQS